MDISAQKTKEDNLKAREATYRGIFENAVEGIYQSTPDGNYLDVNPSLARMYGYRNPQELLTQVRDISRRFMSILPCDRGSKTRLKRQTWFAASNIRFTVATAG